MKKDRNTFFQEAQMSSASYFPNPNMNMMSANSPTVASQASQSYYSGPGVYPNNMMPSGNYALNDLESRLAKMDRQINRLETRVNKLENQATCQIDNYDNQTNMYMV
ncbi:MAG: hypothetical protein IJA94_03670 [Bacilli bacterium]|nr:hypothetical protein [Bacilli bacterium]